VTVVEREIKLAAPPAIALPPLSDPLAGVVAEPAGTLHLLATYYDTDDLRLTRAGASLRHRNDEGWAVKLPKVDGGHDGRLDRATYAVAGDADSPPAEALDLVRALARSAGVGPVARLRTTRRAVRLRTTAGVPIGEVVDDDVAILGGDSGVRGFRELEFELADEAPEAQAASIVARLRAAGAGPPDPTPKIVRALGPRAADPPDVAPSHAPAHTVGDVVRAALAAPVAKLVTHDPGVRRGDDPEDVHQARVATRRLRSHLRTFVPLVDETWAEAVRDELGWLGEALGRVRDADVLLERLEQRIEQLPGPDRAPADRLLDRLRAQRDDGRRELLRALRSHRYAVLLDRLVDAARQPRLAPSPGGDADEERLKGLVRAAWDHLSDAVARLGDDPPDEALHDVRKRAKRARYAAEAVEPMFGKRARGLVRALTEVQDVLGEHQDGVIAAEWLREAAGAVHDEGTAFSAGQLVMQETEAARGGRLAWPPTWREASRKKLRAWL
jgi:CHAD domain-containing protein